MENIDFGRIAFVFEGDWSGNKTYSRLSTVRFAGDGCGYVAIKDNTSVIPGTNDSVWMKIVDKGDKGDKGDTPQIGLETNEQGGVYLLVDGVQVTGPGGLPISLKGPKGDKGNPFTFSDLTDEQKDDLRNAFRVVRGSTTYNEITAALNDGKFLYCIYYGIMYVYFTSGNNTHTFVGLDASSGKAHKLTISSSNGWTGIIENFVKTSAIVTSIGSNSTNAEIPSAKCVYDALAGKQQKIDSSHKLDYSLLTNVPAAVDVSGKEDKSNKVTSLSSSSTNTQYPSAKCVYDQLASKQPLIDANHKLDYSLLTNVPASVDVSGKEDKSNKVTSISASSTDTQYPSAKCLYTIVGNIETLLAAL